MKSILFTVFSLLSFVIFGCQCPELKLLDKQVISSYDLVFLGKFEQAGNCVNSEKQLLFSELEVYKGSVLGSDIKVNFTCGNEACFIDFIAGEQWLVYCKKNNAQNYFLEYCSHTRKLVVDEQVDYQEEIRGTSFFDDKNFMMTNFGVIENNKNDLKPKKYEKLDDELIPVLLGASLIFMIVGMMVFRKRKIK